MLFDVSKMEWTRKPAKTFISAERIEITTEPHTDLWQKTHSHYQADNAPIFQMSTDEKNFSFTVRAEFGTKHQYDQCGIAVYLDSDNWLKASIEYENETFGHLGSVLTSHGYSDWAMTEIPTTVKSMWYRLSRFEDDFIIEYSNDGVTFHLMRMCHMWNAERTIRFGVYACSPEESSFKAVFTNMEMTDCKYR